MAAALGRRDDVDEAAEGRVVAGTPAQRDVDDALALELGRRHVPHRVEHGHRLGEGAAAGDAPGVGERSIRSEVIGVLADASREVEGLGDRLLRALVAHGESDAGHEERRLPHARHELLGQEVGALREDLRIGPVADARAGHALRDLARHAQLAAGDEGAERGVGARPIRPVVEHARLAAVERHRPRLAVTIDLDVEPLRERVDDGGTHPVQATGCGVRSPAELAAGVQLGEDDLDAAQPRARLDVDGDAARLVAHLHAAVRVQHEVDRRPVAAERLVDRVVDDLPQAVHETAGVGGADVHARALADRFEALEHGEMTSGVVGTGHG